LFDNKLFVAVLELFVFNNCWDIEPLVQGLGAPLHSLHFIANCLNFIAFCCILNTLLHFVTLCCTLLHFTTLCHTLSHFVTLYHTLSHFITLCHTLSHFITLCHTLPHFVTLCHTLLHFTAFFCTIWGALSPCFSRSALAV